MDMLLDAYKREPLKLADVRQNLYVLWNAMVRGQGRF